MLRTRQFRLTLFYVFTLRVILPRIVLRRMLLPRLLLHCTRLTHHCPSLLPLVTHAPPRMLSLRVLL